MTIALDWETFGIESRPAFPPKPVGLAYAIREPGQAKRSGYLAFGHPEGNNASAADAEALVRRAYRGDYGTCVFHHSAFDIDVGDVAFDLGFPPNYGDTLFLAFLDDPRQQSLSLKPLAEKYLGRLPVERDELFDWIAAHVRVDGRKIPKSQLGACIAYAPGKLVGSYATADAEMTLALYAKLMDRVRERGMMAAYERELAVAPITMEMERSGLRVNERGLKRLGVALDTLVKKYDTGIRRRLRLADDFNIDSTQQLGEALVKRGKLSKETLTATGKQSTAKNVLIETCNDPDLVKLLSLRSVSDKYLNGFVVPWIEAASKTGGYILPRFNQVRGTDFGGTRTGRFSSSDPNFQNIPSNIADAKDAALLGALQVELEGIGLYGFVGLRQFFLTDPGKLWVAADYSQQELRILAHFEGGALMKAYLSNPNLDVHAYVQELIKKNTGIEYPRKYVKTVVFMLLYGGGAKKLAMMLQISLEDAYVLRTAVLSALPGVKRLMDTTKGEITTWGGRIYKVQDPIIVPHETDPENNEPEIITFEYKQLNTLIQGSAADCTKEGMIKVHQALPDCRIAIQVHDELGVMVDTRKQAQEVAVAMCDVRFNVPMLADPKISTSTWAAAH